MIRIDNELPREAPAREAMLDRAFGPARFVKTCERLREGRLPAEGLSFIARAGEMPVGTLRFWHVEAGGVPALMLGPLAVDERLRSVGIGGTLMQIGLARAAELGHRAIILVGDEPYYARSASAGRWPSGSHCRARSMPRASSRMRSCRAASVRRLASCAPRVRSHRPRP